MKLISRLFISWLVLAILLAACQPSPSPTMVATTMKASPVASSTESRSTSVLPASASPTMPSLTNTPTTTSMPTPTQPPLDTPPPLNVPTRASSQFISAACPFKVPDGLREGDNLHCGYLSVPADRARSNSGTLQLAIAVLHPEDGATEVDPILYLEGGPGRSVLEFLYLTYSRNFKPLLASGRDVILFDQRGVGVSRPALDCPEQDRLFYELLDNEMNGRQLTEQQKDRLVARAMETCAKNLAVKANLTDFSTRASAADVADLVAALGYETVNLWGISYGARLGLEVMRNHPNIVRSAILDSTIPAQADLYGEQPVNLTAAFDQLFQSCAADEACNAAYPDLRQVFFDTVDRLNRESARYESSDPLLGLTYTVAISGNNFIDLVFQFLYDTDVITLIPRLIYNVSQGNYELISLLTGSVIATHGALSDGLYYALQCREEAPFTNPEKIRSAAADFPEFADYFDQSAVQSIFNICTVMGLTPSVPDASANQPIISDIPALILAGEFDPITPPAWGQQAADTLSKAFFFEFPGMGHGVSVARECPRQIMLAFIEDTSHSPKSDCIQEMGAPKFSVPVTAPLNLVPFSNEEMGLQGLSPANWKEVNTGVFSRQATPLDATLVLAQASPVSVDALLQQLARQFGMTEVPKSESQREANGLTWDLYALHVRGLPLALAIAETEGKSFLVLLQSSADEYSALYQYVFLPMVDSVKPLD